MGLTKPITRSPFLNGAICFDRRWNELVVLPAILAAAVWMMPPGPIQGDVSLQEILARPVKNIGSEPRFVSEVFQDVMQSASAPGGLVLLQGGCGTEPEAVVRPQGTTLRHVLDSITKTGQAYRCGVVDLLPSVDVPALLKVKVKLYDSKGANTPGWAASLLFQLPEVRQAEAQLGLRESAFHTGPYGIPPVRHLLRLSRCTSTSSREAC